MANKLEAKQETKEINLKRPHDITVRIIRAKEKPRFERPEEIEEIKKQYDLEENIPFNRGFNVLRSGIVGAFVGVLFTALMLRFGANLNPYEISFMIGIPSFLGLVAGYIIF